MILGGTGFIGSHLADKAINEGYNVGVISLNTPLTQSVNKNIKYIKLDLANLNEVKNFNELNYEYIINLSGYIDHSSYSKQGRSIINTHFNAIQIIIDKLLTKKN